MPLSFILDFDGAITTLDTISTLSHLPISKSPTANTQKWDDITSKYTRDFTSHIQSYNPAKESRHTLEEEIKYQRSLQSVEKRSFQRVSRSGIFANIGGAEWRKYGKEVVERGEVEVRKGFEGFCNCLKKNKGAWGVVSVNFEEEFIRGVLDGVEIEDEDGNKGGIRDGIEILANSSDEMGVLSGPEVEGWEKSGELVVTSDGKLAAMRCLLKTWAKRGLLQESGKSIVYVGDSGTDIECLMEERLVGIVMATDGKSRLLETMRRIGVEVKHVGERKEGDEKEVYWARDFQEIVESLLLR